MQIADAVSLIQAADIKHTPSTWADLGCGNGLFSMALSHILAPQSKIYAIDQTAQQLLSGGINNTAIEFHQADFTIDALPFSLADGILMANSLHYVRNQLPLLQQLKTYLAKDGTFIVVEYDTLQANRWVPYPINYTHLKDLFTAAGFDNSKKLGERPSVYRSSNIYACQFKKG